MKIHCQYTRLVDASELKFNPKNNNKHSPEQIERLAKILEYQGWRYPVKVSNQSGFITSGHGRVLAALKLGWTQVPVSYQDYENPEMEYADLIADNAIASWAELDLSMVNLELQNLGPEFDVDLLAIKDFRIEPLEKFDFDQLKEEPPVKYILEVTFPNDMELMDVHDDLQSRGYIVRKK